MDLQRMLENCWRDQWKANDLDWSRAAKPMSRADETAIVQLFTDMAGIEELAAELFSEQARRTEDETLQKIFRTFVADEERHADVARRLARHYDVHRYQTYRLNPHLVRFRPHFTRAISLLSDEVANAYVTAGELMLDIALLRSVSDFVDDPMCAQAMQLINRDESRHIAIDYHMVEYYGSAEYAARRKAPQPLHREPIVWVAMIRLLYYARPFLRHLFLEPMKRVDPSGRRLKEAFRRMQVLSAKPGVAERPLSRFIRGMQRVYDHPVAGPLFGRAVLALSNVPARFLDHLSADDLARAKRMSFDELAEEALRAKAAG